MNSAGLIVIALMGGAALVLLVVGMAALAWSLWVVRKANAELIRKMDSFSSETKQALDGAKSSFSSIRTELGRMQADFLKDTTAILARNSEEMANAVGRINAEQLEKASQLAIKACHRMESLAVAVQNLLIEREVPSKESTDAPEDYGPDDTLYYRQSETSRLDAEAENEGDFRET